MISALKDTIDLQIRDKAPIIQGRGYVDQRFAFKQLVASRIMGFKGTLLGITKQVIISHVESLCKR